MLDLLLLIILIVCFVRGYHAGLINGIKNIAASLLSLIFAKLFCGIIANFLIQYTSIEAAISQWLTEKFTAVEATEEAARQNAVSGFPALIQDQMAAMLPSINLTGGDFIANLTDLIIYCLSYAILFFILTVGFRIAASFLTFLFDSLAPTRFVNRTAGGLLYGAECLIIYLVLCLVLRPLFLTGAVYNTGFMTSLQDAFNSSVIVAVLEGILALFGLV